MKCIKTGLDIQIGMAIYRADLHIDAGRLHATLNREPMEGATEADMYVPFAYIDRERRPNCMLPEEVAMTHSFFRKLERINPELKAHSFTAHSMAYVHAITVTK